MARPTERFTLEIEWHKGTAKMNVATDALREWIGRCFSDDLDDQHPNQRGTRLNDGQQLAAQIPDDDLALWWQSLQVDRIAKNGIQVIDEDGSLLYILGPSVLGFRISDHETARGRKTPRLGFKPDMEGLKHS